MLRLRSEVKFALCLAFRRSALYFIYLQCAVNIQPTVFIHKSSRFYLLQFYESCETLAGRWYVAS